MGILSTNYSLVNSQIHTHTHTHTVSLPVLGKIIPSLFLMFKYKTELQNEYI